MDIGPLFYLLWGGLGRVLIKPTATLQPQVPLEGGSWEQGFSAERRISRYQIQEHNRVNLKPGAGEGRRPRHWKFHTPETVQLEEAFILVFAALCLGSFGFGG